ncbi:MAG: GNAT family N-acetyltransferase [Thermoanaerobaculia bacterium]
MAIFPADREWTIRSLATGDEEEALAFLRRDVLANVYFISRILDEGLGPRGQTVEIRRGGKVVALASLTTNVVLAAAAALDPGGRQRAMEQLAARIVSRGIPVRAIISDETLVDPLWSELEAHVSPPTVVRLRQPVYALRAGPTDLPDLDTVRFATEADLPRLVPACAAMHLEEVGIDPLARDAPGYRQRIRELVDRRRSLVRVDGGRIAFKCEYSAVTPEAVQLMGVWTAPPYRRRGLARRGIAEVCGHLLRERRAVTLFVNDFNTPAIHLYESLGFRRIGTNRALIW